MSQNLNKLLVLGKILENKIFVYQNNNSETNNYITPIFGLGTFSKIVYT